MGKRGRDRAERGFVLVFALRDRLRLLRHHSASIRQFMFIRSWGAQQRCCKSNEKAAQATQAHAALPPPE